jgi:hypothetical protein
MAHITLQPCSSLIDTDNDESDNADVISPGASRTVTSPVKRLNNAGKDNSPLNVDFLVDLEKTFAVHINIERAFHLPMVLDNRQGVKPSSYVSYQTADQHDLTCTEIVPDTNDPVWCHENDCRLSTDLLTSDNMRFVLKVWHKPKGTTQAPDKAADKALGFVSVDLMPLTKGFPHIAGFYNIIDFNGLCQGQIKVSVVPTAAFTVEYPSKSGSQVLNSSTVFVPTPTNWLPVHPSLPHFSEHFESIRRHHSELQQQLQQQATTDDPSSAASKSVLFNTLRNNLKELENMTANLRQRLLVGRDIEEHAQDSDTAVPLSTSSALITCGSTLLDGTWGFQSTLHGNQQLAPDPLTSTGGSATTKDAVVEMMRCTLERTGSTVPGEPKDNYSMDHVACSRSESSTSHKDLVDENYLDKSDEHLSDYDDDKRRPNERGDIARYADSLRNAQVLLEQLNRLTANEALQTPGIMESGNLMHHSSLTAHEYSSQQEEHFDDFENDDADDVQEEDTFANIWAMRQSVHRDVASDSGD